MFVVYFKNNQIGYISHIGNKEQAKEEFFNANPEYKKNQKDFMIEKI
ncbi:MAG: hypothetical protein PHD20_02760 [Clostridia bacterium]|nr:hypothetical protein [Clostridia bacterium]